MINRYKLMYMTNKELAYFLRYRTNCECCIFEFDDDNCKSNFCIDGVERWLESECDTND